MFEAIPGRLDTGQPLALKRVVTDPLAQQSPTPGPQADASPWPVRNRAAQQEVSGGRASEASSTTRVTA